MFEEALLNTLMGMGTVFGMLILISVVISLFGFIPRLLRRWHSFRRRIGFRRKREAQPQEAKVPKRPQLPKEYTEKPAEDKDDTLIAVIMAAIVASEGGAVSADSLRVRSIRRVQRNR